MPTLRSSLISFTSAIALTVSAGLANAEIKVVTSIKPIHSLAASLLEGVAEPTLIVEGNQSPHDFALKPSKAGLLQSADLVFWIGPELESFLEKPISTIAVDAKSIPLMQTSGLNLLPLRETGNFQYGHDHASHGELDDHADDDNDHVKHDDHEKHDDHADHKEHDHDKHEDHEESVTQDPHIWMNPKIASQMVVSMEAALVTHDPSNAETYATNAGQLQKELIALDEELHEILEPVEESQFINFHDSLQYFEEQYHVHSADVITINPATPPSASRVSEIRKALDENAIHCIVTEPQFNSKIVDVIAEGHTVRKVELDPLGREFSESSEQYFQAMRTLAKAIATCLKTNS